MSTPQRILIATIDYPPIQGGISTLTRETAQALADQGHEVTVLAPRIAKQDPGSPSLPLPLGEGRGEGERRTKPMQSSCDPEKSGGPGSRGRSPSLTVVHFRGYHLGVFRLIPFLWTALPLARKHDHILAMNIAYGGILGLIARTLFGKPYTAYAYAYEFLKFRRIPPVDSLIRLLYRRAERTVAISAYSRDHLIAFGVPAERIVVAHPGAAAVQPIPPEAVDAMRHRLAVDHGPVILSAGRLIPRKRHANLVHAFARALRAAPDAWLVIAGQGPEMPWISRQASRLGIRDRVILPGAVSDGDLQQLYALCTLFALPCGEDASGQVEGFGLVFTEANAHGKPVIGGRSGGVPDAIVDGDTGLLVEPDNLEALTEALVRLLEDSALAERMGEQGRARNAASLSWTAFANAAFGILPSDTPPSSENP